MSSTATSSAWASCRPTTRGSTTDLRTRRRWPCSSTSVWFARTSGTVTALAGWPSTRLPCSREWSHRWVGRLSQLLAESAAWADTFSALAQAFRRTPATGSQTSEIRGLPSINRFLESAVDDAESELLTAQPAGARRAVILQQAIDRDVRALERGVQMRTLYQHTARRSKATRDYVEHILDHGAQVRTLDEFFNRLIVIDRRLAIIPGGQPDVAVAIHDPHLVSYLADIFDRFWERAREYNERGSSSESDIAAEVRQLTVRMLTEGHSDPASAKRVGVSTRTYASYVAALKDEYGVETRFQLGFAMGSRDPESAPERAD